MSSNFKKRVGAQNPEKVLRNIEFLSTGYEKRMTHPYPSSTIFELTKKHLPSAKVTAITGHSEKDPACVAMGKKGAVDVIVKPFECGEQLIERIKTSLSK